MNKTLWTLNIDNYAPEITQLTYPFLLAYAKKISAEFRIINDWRLNSSSHPWLAVYEKLQLFELGRGSDWNLYVDSDALIFPDMFDLTERVHKDTVVHHGRDQAGNRWTYDNYFRRDGRAISSCNWFTLASDWCLDLWHPLDDLSLAEAVKNITPIAHERLNGVTAEHLIDDYILSRNIARYGLKFKTVGEIQEESGDAGKYFYHRHTVPVAQRVSEMTQLIKMFGGSPAPVGMPAEDWIRDYAVYPVPKRWPTADPEFEDVRTENDRGHRPAR
jgi:hypothetical protein